MEKIKKDVDLTGGTRIEIEFIGDVNENVLKEILKDYEIIDIKKEGRLYKITFQGEIDEKSVLQILKDAGYKYDNYSIQKISPLLAEKFYSQMIGALLVAFLFMSIVVFFIFRNPLPSCYILFAIAADIFEAFVFSQLLGVPLSIPTISALLLLIGYSVDTDILLTTKVLKHAGTVEEGLNSAFKTGITMSVTTICAVLPILFISSSEILRRIATVLLLGISLDIINTWCMNAVLLRWWIERKWRG
jgi:preprotein translocase subunit SecF